MGDLVHAMGLSTLVMGKMYQQAAFLKNVRASYSYGEFRYIANIFNSCRINMS